MKKVLEFIQLFIKKANFFDKMELGAIVSRIKAGKILENIGSVQMNDEL